MTKVVLSVVGLLIAVSSFFVWLVAGSLDSSRAVVEELAGEVAAVRYDSLELLGNEVEVCYNETSPVAHIRFAATGDENIDQEVSSALKAIGFSYGSVGSKPALLRERDDTYDSDVVFVRSRPELGEVELLVDVYDTDGIIWCNDWLAQLGSKT